MISWLIPMSCAMVIAIPAAVIALMQSNAACKAFGSIVRQPDVFPIIKTLFLVTLAFLETLVIYCLMISIMLVNKIS